MSEALSLSQIRQKLADEEVSDRALDQLMGLILAARAYPNQLERQKQEATDNIVPILAAELISLPGQGTTRDEAERLVEVAVRYI